MKWLGGCSGSGGCLVGLIVAIIAFSVASNYLWKNSPDSSVWPIVTIISLIVAVAAGIIGWIVVAWLLGKIIAILDSS